MIHWNFKPTQIIYVNGASIMEAPLYRTFFKKILSFLIMFYQI